MLKWGFLVLFGIGASHCAEVTTREVFVSPGTKGIPVETENYPDSPPDNFEIHWKLRTAPGAHFRLWCDDVRFHQQLSCKDNGMQIIDGGKVEDVCGVPYDLTRITQSEDLEVRVWARGYPFSFVHCKAQAQLKGSEFELEEGEVIEGPPPGPTIPPPYKTVPSEEIDSSEHGGPPGRKPTTCPCGTANKAGGGQRIYGGQDAEPNEFPFLVALSEQVSLWAICGASIITPYHALTAAHCTRQKQDDGKALCILVATHNHARLNESSTYYKVNVKQVIEHEGYIRKKILNDISLLVLEEKLNFDKFTMPVCLPWKKINLDNKTVKNMGWGRTGPDAQEMNHIVKEVAVRVLPHNECKKVWSSFLQEEEQTKICLWSRKGTVCVGDSGSPVVWLDPETNRYTLVGLNSFGPGTCGSSTPSVATKIEPFMPWIVKQIENTIPQPVCYRQD